MHYPHILEGIAERNTSLTEQERGHLMDLARLLRATPAERFAKLNEHSKAHMQALADLVGLPSREFKGFPEQDWIRRDEAMRLVPALRDHGSALAVLLREEIHRAAGVPEAAVAQPEKLVPDPACSTCRGHGRYVAGYSGREDDGNAPLWEECDCFIPATSTWLLPDDMQALQRFCETCEDSQPYDVPKDRMRRLAELGVVQWSGGYSITAFGQHVLDLLPEGWPRLPLKTHADHNAYVNAEIDRASGKVTDGVKGAAMEANAKKLMEAIDRLAWNTVSLRLMTSGVVYASPYTINAAERLLGESRKALQDELERTLGVADRVTGGGCSGNGGVPG